MNIETFSNEFLLDLPPERLAKAITHLYAMRQEWEDERAKERDAFWMEISIFMPPDRIKDISEKLNKLLKP